MQAGAGCGRWHSPHRAGGQRSPAPPPKGKAKESTLCAERSICLVAFQKSGWDTGIWELEGTALASSESQRKGFTKITLRGKLFPVGFHAPELLTPLSLLTQGWGFLEAGL